MRLCIMLDTGKVIAEFDSNDVKKLLSIYFDKYHDISKAYEEVEKDLKNKVLIM